jgi:arylsulfatase
MVQQYVAKLAQTAINYPPMQAPASFNLEAIQKEIQQKIQEHQGQ